MQEKNSFNEPKNFTNRELSWLQFNDRILKEACDSENPLMERVNFLGITASNLDEFFMVRVASLKDMIHAGYTKKDLAGMTAGEQLDAIAVETHRMIEAQYQVFNQSLLPELVKEGICFISRHEDLTEEEGEYVDDYFHRNIYPVLTPMAVDSSRPFPLIRNKTLNIAALIKNKSGEKEYEVATVQVPSVLQRVITLPQKEGEERRVLLLEQVIERNIHQLFLNYEVKCAHPYRIMRNADLTIDEEEAEDLLKEIERQVRRRQWGEVIKLEYEEGMDPELAAYLEGQLGVQKADIYPIDGPLDLTFLMKLYDLEGLSRLKETPYEPQPVENLRLDETIFEQIKKKDVLMHHPYDSFDPVLWFIHQAAVDPDVLAIKMTLYRVSGHSPIITSLALAAENGKQVTVLVELKARFDEANNIVWAKKLEQAGCHVIYGLVGLKTHSKITLVVRKEAEGIKRYVHLGTGNYNDSTAKRYTDLGFFTANDLFGEDATAVFNMLSGYSEPAHWEKLAVAPIWLKHKFLELIGRETRNALEGKEARIVAKMNSLCDPDMICALYRASCAGVKIQLIVRGICCLIAGRADLSENIEVRSIVGQFLEHGRIYYFYNGGHEEVYLGSADWMPRNLERRVEIIFPVEDEDLKERIKEILAIQLADNRKAHMMQEDGTYKKPETEGEERREAQRYFCEAAEQRQICQKNEKKRIFEPIFGPESAKV